MPDWVKEVFVTAHDIAPEAHVRMQAAFQAHTDNAVSKTINFPNEATVEDVATAYQLAYDTGCKGITIYRDGSRDLQVLKHAGEEESDSEEAAAEAIAAAEALVAEKGRPIRRRLPDERQSITHKFRVGEQEGYMTVGLFADGTPGELFVNVSKQGSTVMALMDSLAMLTSYALQFGVPVSVLTSRMQGSRFEPSGPTGNPEIPIATSITDYIFRWLELKFRRTPSRPCSQRSSRRTRSPRAGAWTSPRCPTTNMVPSGVGCPDCGAVLYYGEGCLLCRSCGYNKCG